MSYKAMESLEMKIKLDFLKTLTPEDIDRILTAKHARVLELEKQVDDLKAAMIKAADLWTIDHLSHEPIDILNEAIG